jgi:hypothetical protein
MENLVPECIALPVPRSLQESFSRPRDRASGARRSQAAQKLRKEEASRSPDGGRAFTGTDREKSDCRRLS